MLYSSRTAGSCFGCHAEVFQHLLICHAEFYDKVKLFLAELVCLNRSQMDSASFKCYSVKKFAGTSFMMVHYYL
jgi:hypothetical protein